MKYVIAYRQPTYALMNHFWLVKIFVTNQLFTLTRNIVGVSGESHIDCVVLTLCKDLLRNYSSSLFEN